MKQHISNVCTCNDCKCGSTTLTTGAAPQFKAWHLESIQTISADSTLRFQPAARLAELQAKQTLTEGERLEVEHLLKLVWG